MFDDLRDEMSKSKVKYMQRETSAQNRLAVVKKEVGTMVEKVLGEFQSAIGEAGEISHYLGTEYDKKNDRFNIYLDWSFGSRYARNYSLRLTDRVTPLIFTAKIEFKDRVGGFRPYIEDQTTDISEQGLVDLLKKTYRRTIAKKEDDDK